MESYINMCGVFGCFEVYEAQHQHSECPRCGISRAEIIAFRSNDRDFISKKKIDKEFDELYNDSLGG